MERLTLGMRPGREGGQPAPSAPPPTTGGPSMRLNLLAGVNPGLFHVAEAVTPAVPAARPPSGIAFQPPVPPPPGVGTPPAVAAPGGIAFQPPIATALRPELTAIRPDLLTLVRPGPQILPFPFPSRPAPVSQTATQLARSAMVTLDNASPAVLNEAVDIVRGRNLPASGLLDYLERRVRVGEVLNQLAATWSDTTVDDFALAMQMGRDKQATMDVIVALAILNEADLEEELLAENLPPTSDSDLIDNRVIVDQWPPGGMVMQPPYVVLVAVEYRNIAEAQEVVNSIVNELVEHDGTRMTRSAAQKLRSR